MDARKRIFVTLAVVALVVVAGLLPLPGVPPQALDPWGGQVSLFPPHRLRLLSLGIQPYLAASALWLLISGLIDPLRRRREGTAAERVSFDRVIVVLALVLTFVQGFATGIDLRILATIHGAVGPSPFVIAVTLSAATAALVGMALLVTRAGVGNGVVWIAIATTYLTALRGGVARELARAAESEVGLFHVPIALTALVGLVVLCWFYLRSARDVSLVPIAGRETPVALAVPPIPLRLNLTGVVPAAVATSLLDLPAAIAGVLPNPPSWLTLPPAVHWTLLVVLVIVLTYVFTGIGFDTRRVGAMLARHGYAIEGAGDRSTEEFLDALIEKRILVSAAILVALVLLPGPALEAATGISLSRAGLSGEVVLLLCAVAFDTLRNEPDLRPRALRETREEGGAPGEEDAPDTPAPDTGRAWVTVFESDVEFETRLALATLEANGIHGMARSNRVIPLAGTLAFWEWTVPTYPSLVIHRRLGGGRAVVRVLATDADRARALLAGVAEA